MMRRLDQEDHADLGIIDDDRTEILTAGRPPDFSGSTLKRDTAGVGLGAPSLSEARAERLHELESGGA